jgi:hypothetical protein
LRSRAQRKSDALRCNAAAVGPSERVDQGEGVEQDALQEAFAQRPRPVEIHPLEVGSGSRGRPERARERAERRRAKAARL